MQGRWRRRGAPKAVAAAGRRGRGRPARASSRGGERDVPEGGGQRGVRFGGEGEKGLGGAKGGREEECLLLNAQAGVPPRAPGGPPSAGQATELNGRRRKGGVEPKKREDEVQEGEMARPTRISRAHPSPLDGGQPILPPAPAGGVDRLRGRGGLDVHQCGLEELDEGRRGGGGPGQGRLSGGRPPGCDGARPLLISPVRVEETSRGGG